MHGFPHVCVSLGLIYKRLPVLGVIYNPFLDQLYYGVKGQGSYLAQGGREPAKLPLAIPRPLSSLSQALIGEHGMHLESSAMGLKIAQVSNGALTARTTSFKPRATLSSGWQGTRKRAS